MGKNRLETFSDGVIAILITIMVLELKVPHSPDFRALIPLWPVFMSYVLSFIYIGIYWNKLQYANHPSFRSDLTFVRFEQGTGIDEHWRNVFESLWRCFRPRHLPQLTQHE
jgi:hypothetical protein